MSYPTPRHLTHDQPTTALTSLTSTAITAVFSTATLPWHIFLQWLSWCCGIAVHSSTSLGAPPPRGYVPAANLKELTSIINHMHTREDLYRRAVKELQEELETRDIDRKRALRKLRSTRNEIEVLTEKLTELQTAHQATISSGGDGKMNQEQYENVDYSLSNSNSSISSVGVHVTVLCSAGAVWWFSQTDHAALHWKLVMFMFFPLLFAYVSWLTAVENTAANGRYNRKTEAPLLMMCALWFLVGFAVALSLGQ